MLRYLLVLTSCFATVPALSQSAQNGVIIAETRCWIGSVSFSPGLTANIGGKVMLCEQKGSWGPAPHGVPASGCIYAGQMYSTQAQIPSPGSKGYQYCTINGTWLEPL